MKYDTCLDTFKFVSLYTLHFRLQQMNIEPNVRNTTYYLKSSIFWNILPCSPLKGDITTASMLVSCSAYSTLKMEAICPALNTTRIRWVAPEINHSDGRSVNACSETSVLGVLSEDLACDNALAGLACRRRDRHQAVWIWNNSRKAAGRGKQ
jgi:hypothetical protein